MKLKIKILLANPLSFMGLLLISLVFGSAIFADFITPFPLHKGAVVDFSNFNQAPNLTNIMGTDLVGRDLFTRIIYAFRISIMLGVVVLIISVPIGVFILCRWTKLFLE